MPDVKATMAAIELLLGEGLGGAPQAEETAAARLSARLGAVREIGWDDMQSLFAALYVDEIVFCAVRRWQVARPGEARRALGERTARTA
jgi:hypothetical protein